MLTQNFRQEDFTLGWGWREVGKKKDLLEPRTAAKGLGVCNFFSPGGPEKRRRCVRGPSFFFREDL